MIERMLKLMIAVRSTDRLKLLHVLRDLGILHLTPVDPAEAIPDEDLIQKVTRTADALKILYRVGDEEEGEAPPVSDLVEEVLAANRHFKNVCERLSALKLQLEEQEVWGDTTTQQITELRKAGLRIRFFDVPEKELSQVKADLIHRIREEDGRVLIGTVMREGYAEVPESAEQLRILAKDNPTLREELKGAEIEFEEARRHLGLLGKLRSQLEEREKKLQTRVEYATALKGGYDNQDLFALQGWVPETSSAELVSSLQDAEIEAGMQLLPPKAEELPPTLIRYPRWAKPIKGLFDILGTFPGYFELDLSGFFMLALPLFAGILIGDAGYGLIFFLSGIVFYKKLVSIAGKAKTQLLIIIGAATLVYGILTANYFGVTPESLVGMEGAFWISLGDLMRKLALLWDPNPNVAREIIIKLSFLIGCLHLMVAHLRLLIGYAPNMKAVAELGWCLFLIGMFGLVWRLFFPGQAAPLSMSLVNNTLIWGAALIVLFSFPHTNPFKRIGIGFASSILPWLAAFSDLMSYIRLMAVGLASFYIAAAANQLASDAAGAGTWLVGTVILLIGHGLNLALGAIAVFAHGVRLNMLEFSNNAGVEWGGYGYSPFAGSKIEEN